MAKVSVPLSNHFCPQTLFLFGTYKEDGTPNFGLFCWFSYCWDGELGVMACIGGEKLTKDRIRATGVFSANLVTEAMLPVADYLGVTSGYSPGKMDIGLEVVPGEVLQVPLLADSPWSFELEVKQTIPLDDSDVFLCKIRNVMADEALADKNRPVEERFRLAAPALTTHQTYFSAGNPLGVWGQWEKLK
ncbi:flavin reductase family protein [Paenibacillus sp. YN15]|uniref:flavin reductase family protein n=1 Tax=Paenibacillus sp. YN15 TaxID=1742774 RepID=UPI000DCDE2FC|nr:flavin reductase [Paenibacillus sp. YN15]RAV04625.1 flavin reductase [Paenibacillus sp. YN15]